jgi:hypothetical protein
MAMRQIVVDVPEQVLLAEKRDEADFGRELCTLAALELYELGRLSPRRTGWMICTQAREADLGELVALPPGGVPRSGLVREALELLLGPLASRATLGPE